MKTYLVNKDCATPEMDLALTGEYSISHDAHGVEEHNLEEICQIELMDIDITPTGNDATDAAKLRRLIDAMDETFKEILGEW